MANRYSAKERRGLLGLAAVLTAVLVAAAVVSWRDRRGASSAPSAEPERMPDTLILQHPDTVKLDATRKRRSKRTAAAKDRTRSGGPKRSPLDEPIPKGE